MKTAPSFTASALSALDPRHSWHGSFRYWYTKLRGVISVISEHEELPYNVALQRVRRSVACIELVPYHSTSFKLPARHVDQLHSANLARQYVHETLIPRAHKGECLIVVARAARHWHVEPGKNVIVYEGSAARSAHLTPQSEGGKAILEFLTRTD